MKKKIYIHIGNFKTGSTLIQKFLFLNKKLLAKKNIGTIYEKQIYFKHNINNLLLFKHFEKLDEKKIFDYLKKNKLKHLIISSEYFSTLSLEKKKIRFIKKVAHKLGYKPKIIFFYRRGFSYFYSFYSELLKQKKILKKSDSIFDYLYKLNRYGYYFYNKNKYYFLSHNYYFKNNVIKKNWKQVFKKDFISIKFDKKEKDKFLYDFINFLGLNKFDVKIPKAQNQSKIKFWHIKRIFNFLIIYFYYFLKLKNKFE